MKDPIKERPSAGGDIRPLLCALAVTVIWGSFFPFVQYGFSLFGLREGSTADLMLFAGVRFFLAGALLSARCIAKRDTAVLKNRRSICSLLMVALFAVVLHYSFSYVGLSIADSAKTALLKQAFVLIFICFSFLFIKEDRFSVGKLLGGILSALSVVAVSSQSLHISFGAGEALIAAASLCTVLHNTVTKKRLSDASPLAVTGFSQLFGGAALICAGLISGGKFGAVSPAGIPVMLYLVLMTVVSYSLWYRTVQRYDLSRLFTVKMGEPVFAALFSLLLPVKKEFGVGHIIAFLLVAAAIAVGNIRIKKTPSSGQIIKNTEKRKNESNADTTG